MTFLSNVEREFNEILGDLDEDEYPERSKLEEDFTDQSYKKDREDSEFDADDASKVLRKSARRSDKQCRVGDKIYEVGDRWKDEKTGRDMICILMNIPKEIQPRLEEADVTITSNEHAKEQWSRPSVEPEWEYTAHPRKKRTRDRPEQGEQSNDQEIENDVGIPERIQVEEDKTQASETQTKHTDQEDQVIESIKPDEEPPEKEEGKVEDLETLTVTSEITDPVPEPQNCNVEEVTEETLKKPITEFKAEPIDEVSDLETDSDFQQHESKEAAESDTDIPEDMEGEETPKVESVKDYEIVVDDSQTQKAKRQTDTMIEQLSKKSKPEFETVEESLVENIRKGKESEVVEVKQTELSDAEVPRPIDKTKNTEVISSENDVNVLKEERGTPIYTKETVIKRRKLFKTQETIETTEPYTKKQ